MGTDTVATCKTNPTRGLERPCLLIWWKCTLAIPTSSSEKNTLDIPMRLSSQQCKRKNLDTLVRRLPQQCRRGHPGNSHAAPTTASKKSCIFYPVRHREQPIEPIFSVALHCWELPVNCSVPHSLKMHRGRPGGSSLLKKISHEVREP